MDIEKHMNYKERRVLEQLQQVLNLRTNFLSDDKNVSELFTHYTNALNVSQGVKHSLKISEECYTDLTKVNKALHSLKKDNSESFLIVNFKAQSHMFSSVIRKIDDAYSVTIVNRASRTMYKEFIVDEAKSQKLSRILEQSQNRLGTSSIYYDFEIVSKINFNLRVKSLHQKGMNCFLKEPESAIKYAVATAKNSIDELKDFRKTQRGFILKNFSEKKAFYKPKWPNLKTIEAHGKYYKDIADKNRSIEPKLTFIFDIYKQNKNFRRYLNNNIPRKESFDMAFHKNRLIKEYQKFDYSDSKYSHISIETAIKKQKDIAILLRSDNKLSCVNSFNSIIGTYKHILNLKEYDRTFDEKFIESQSLLKKHADKIKEMEKDFPFLMYQIKGDICAHLFNFAYDNYKQNKNHQLAIDRISYAIDVYPRLPNYYLVRGNIYKKIGNMQKAADDYEKALKMGPVDEYAKQILREIQSSISSGFESTRKE